MKEYLSYWNGLPCAESCAFYPRFTLQRSQPEAGSLCKHRSCRILNCYCYFSPHESSGNLTDAASKKKPKPHLICSSCQRTCCPRVRKSCQSGGFHTTERLGGLIWATFWAYARTRWRLRRYTRTGHLTPTHTSLGELKTPWSRPNGILHNCNAPASVTLQDFVIVKATH